MESKHSATLLIVVSLLAFGWVITDTILSSDLVSKQRSDSTRARCWPISPSLSMGTVRCWSGGNLVYNRAIYHNGGVLCSVDGQQITLNKADLCVIESRQSNVWSPPPPVDR